MLRRQRTQTVEPFVQFLRLGDDLICECVASTAVGGYCDMTPQQEAALFALGWRLYEGDVNLRQDHPLADVHSVAQLAVATLAALSSNPLLAHLTEP